MGLYLSLQFKIQITRAGGLSYFGVAVYNDVPFYLHFLGRVKQTEPEKHLLIHEQMQALITGKSSSSGIVFVLLRNTQITAPDIRSRSRA